MNTLPRADAAIFEEHLLTCSQCTAAVEDAELQPNLRPPRKAPGGALCSVIGSDEQAASTVAYAAHFRHAAFNVRTSGARIASRSRSSDGCWSTGPL
jgi:hypothetical protein